MRHGNVGYTAAVDMWSIGNITAVLLSGQEVFGVPTDSKISETQYVRMVQKKSKICDLDEVFKYPVWKEIDKRPKDFIRKLLVIDDARRLTPAQALEHKWFTHPAHKVEFEALYDRVTANWRPRSMKENRRTELRLDGDYVYVEEKSSRSKYFS